jgi:CspA family cold shock protein
MSLSVATQTTTESSTQTTGRVKWFNNKSGYGFITVQEGNYAGSDIFVHHTSLKVGNDQYKYLIEGEYVDFELQETASENHKVHAVNVVGIKGGKLMCETRHDLKMIRSNYRSSEVKEVTVPRQQNPPEEDNSKQWSVVEKSVKKKQKPVVKKINSVKK